jgi:hypothetical protein
LRRIQSGEVDAALTVQSETLLEGFDTLSIATIHESAFKRLSETELRLYIALVERRLKDPTQKPFKFFH